MTRKLTQKGRGDRWNGRILDPRPGEEHLDQLTVVERALLPRSKRVKPEPLCCCPPPQHNRLGGCRPGLKRVGDQLEPICFNCQRPLLKGRHKRRQQTHVIGLAELPIDALDLEDLVDAGLLRSTPFDPGQLDRAMHQFELDRVGGLP